MHNVLLVPGLKCNLILVFQLVRHGKYDTYFTYNFFTVQDRTSGKVIGEEEQLGGRYYFKGTTFVATLQSADRVYSEVWHRRLGHLGEF